MRGTDDDSYLKLAEYLHVLKLVNPGTISDLETETNKKGSERFLYLFLAFGVSISGFKRLRCVLVLDGTHLSRKYKSVLLTASGQDANFQVYSLAFAVVESENDDAWTWFMQKLECIIVNSVKLTLIYDRRQTIYTPKKRLFPLPYHGACIVHLVRNVNSNFRIKGLTKLVGQADFENRVGGFCEAFNQINMLIWSVQGS